MVKVKDALFNEHYSVEEAEYATYGTGLPSVQAEDSRVLADLASGKDPEGTLKMTRNPLVNDKDIPELKSEAEKVTEATKPRKAATNKTSQEEVRPDTNDNDAKVPEGVVSDRGISTSTNPQTGATEEAEPKK